MNRLTEVIHVRTTKTLAYETATIASFYGIDKSDFIRLCLYQGVERYYLKEDRRVELLQELGRLSVRDNIMFVESKREGT